MHATPYVISIWQLKQHISIWINTTQSITGITDTPFTCIISIFKYNTLFWVFCDGFCCVSHDDVIKWKHFPRYCKGQWRGALIFSLICVWINGWLNKREAGDLRRYRVHCDAIVMLRLMGRSTRWCQTKIGDILQTFSIVFSSQNFCVWLCTGLKFVHDDATNGNIFRVSDILWGESTVHRWIPLTKTNDAEL